MQPSVVKVASSSRKSNPKSTESPGSSNSSKVLWYSLARRQHSHQLLYHGLGGLADFFAEKNNKFYGWWQFSQWKNRLWQYTKSTSIYMIPGSSKKNSHPTWTRVRTVRHPWSPNFDVVWKQRLAEPSNKTARLAPPIEKWWLATLI